MNPVTLLVLLVVFVMAMINWRGGVWAALIAAVYEGALRKWVLPGFQNQLFFFKDALLLGAYVGYFIGSRHAHGQPMVRRHPANILLVLMLAICTLEVLNPWLPTPLLGLLGWQGYVFYVPLMYMVPELVPTQRCLRRFGVWMLAISAIPLLLGPIQFASAPGSYVNRYARPDASLSEIATLADQHVRVTGTFSYITGFSTFLTFLFLLLLAQVLLQPKGRKRMVLYGALSLTLANILMTGTRAAVLMLIGCAPVMLWMSLHSGKRRDVQIALVGAIITPVLVLATLQAFPQATAEFMHRTSESKDVPERMHALLNNPITALEQAGVAGWGIGAEHQVMWSNNVFEAADAGEHPTLYEYEWERIIMETGPFGFLVVIGARVLVSVYLWKMFRTNTDRHLRPYLAAAFVLSVAFINYELVYVHSLGLFYWFLAGFAFLPKTYAAASQTVPRVIIGVRHRDAASVARLSSPGPAPQAR